MLTHCLKREKRERRKTRRFGRIPGQRLAAVYNRGPSDCQERRTPPDRTRYQASAQPQTS